MSHDALFMRRRMNNAIGHHVWLRCDAWEASDVLQLHLAEVVDRLTARPDLTIRVSRNENPVDSSAWK